MDCSVSSPPLNSGAVSPSTENKNPAQAGGDVSGRLGLGVRMGGGESHTVGIATFFCAVSLWVTGIIDLRDKDEINGGK